MRIFLNIIGVALISAGLCCSAWGDSLDNFRAAARKITSIQADFIQEKQLPILAHPLKAAGRFVYRAPASLRWEYVQPIRRLLLMQNGEVRRFTQAVDGDLKEETITAPYMNAVMTEIAKWMSGRFDETEMFVATFLSAKNKIILTPREDTFRDLIARIEIVLDSQPGIITEVVIYEDQVSFTRFRFLDPTLNVPLADDLFQALK